eukprot:s2195_g12.t1
MGQDVAAMCKRRQGQERCQRSGRRSQVRKSRGDTGADFEGDGQDMKRHCADFGKSGTAAMHDNAEHYELPLDGEKFECITGEGVSAGLKGPGTKSAEPVLTGATITAPGDQALNEKDAGCESFPAPSSREGWLQLLATCSNLRQMGIALAWGYLHSFMTLGDKSAGPSRSSKQSSRSGGLFPLPVLWPDDFSGRWHTSLASSSLDFSAQCWVACACLALNRYYGCRHDGPERKPGKVHRGALQGLTEKITRFLEGESFGDVNFLDAVRDLKTKRVSYTGEEVSQPMALSAEQIERSLPPEGHGGCIQATDFLVGRTKFLLENPQECFVPLRERPIGNMQPEVHIRKGEELSVFKLLERRGVISWLPIEQVYTDEQGECLNGMFGVVKPGKFTSSGTQILRVIMNLVPANRLFQVICGDIQLLPHGAAWIPLVVSGEEELYVSQGDMSAAFYLFSIPAAWQPFMCLGYKAEGSQVGGMRQLVQTLLPCAPHGVELLGGGNADD